MATQPYRKSNRSRPLGATLRSMRRGRAAHGPDRAAINRVGLRKKRKKRRRRRP